ncbi:MAG TPA: HD domain-containing protein [Acidimicrobiales bacterium]|nr:HD domain-containing protein [Acidimicrobiales bacterium]
MREFVSWQAWDDADPELADELPAEVHDVVARATEAAQQWHSDQRRPTGVPYVEHLLEALEVLVRGAGVSDPDVLAAVLLHDVAEDTAATVADVEAQFGPGVAGYVDWLTKPPTQGRSEAEKRAAKGAYLQRFADAPPEAVWVKLADRVSNVQRLYQMPLDFQRRYYAETVDRVVPLAQGHGFFAAWYDDWQHRYAHLNAL